VAAQHQATAAKGVRDDAIGARVRVALLDGEDALGMSQIPEFAAVALLKAGQHELRAHGAVAHEPALPQRFKEWWLHRM
jgi:hypothetical protein